MIIMIRLIPAQLATCCCTQLHSALRRVPTEHAERVARVFKRSRDLNKLSYDDQQAVVQMLLQLCDALSPVVDIQMQLGKHRQDAVQHTRSLGRNGVRIALIEKHKLPLGQQYELIRLQRLLSEYGVIHSLEEFLVVIGD